MELDFQRNGPARRNSAPAAVGRAGRRREEGPKGRVPRCWSEQPHRLVVLCAFCVGL